MAIDPPDLDACLRLLARRLLDRRTAHDHWDGCLASSALSTGTAVLALYLVASHRKQSGDALDRFVVAGTRWLTAHQNPDGGWGDTVRSRSNISTTAIVWAALSKVGEREDSAVKALARSEAWLHSAAGGVTPDVLRAAILRRYGKDRTFSVPILTVLALAGKLGADNAAAWRLVPQLPFELAAFPHGWFQHLRLPVVSYALPALIAIGQVRHRFAPSRDPLTRLLRSAVRRRTHRVLREMQPESGGYLEATPLTSFVVMSLAGAGQADSPVVDAGEKFLAESMRPDGGWPIDTNLSTWVTTLSIGALTEVGALSASDRAAMRRWLISQQSAREHPFTHAAKGGWAWTPLSGGVPDADDTSGALVALRQLGEPDSQTLSAAAEGSRWLLGVQNRDGGIPTFCRGWGTLPFDRSTPEITAHALRAWSVWHSHFEPAFQKTLHRASGRALAYLAATQRPDGSWIPLWFGNEQVASEDNPVYGTARVLAGLEASLVRTDPRADDCRGRAIDWLLAVQNGDGGWGGDRAVRSSIEETGVVLSGLGRLSSHGARVRTSGAVHAGVRWLIDALGDSEVQAAPLGLYFARLWYFEDLYPLIFSLDGLARVRSISEAAKVGAEQHPA
ncbi:MAG: squalene--hopene cyclase [Blastocatellia bacterium]|nr:MAG: squalene--hopene cyclase [Blastocatellia bacterium]